MPGPKDSFLRAPPQPLSQSRGLGCGVFPGPLLCSWPASEPGGQATHGDSLHTAVPRTRPPNPERAPGPVSLETGEVITHCSPSTTPYRPHAASTFVQQMAGKSGLLGPHTQEQAKGFSQAPDWKKGTKLEAGAPSRPRPLHAAPAGPARAGSVCTGPHPQAGPRSPLGPLLPPEHGQPLPVWEHTPTSEHVAQGKNKHFLEAKVGEKS